jgi:KUP system potassium uptake protein
VESPFYQLAPQWSHYGLVVLATLATVIASQAIITGAYSLTQQAIQLVSALIAFVEPMRRSV